MKTHILAAIVFAASSSLAHAQNATEKAMKDHPGHTGAGTTANPTAKPDLVAFQRRRCRTSRALTRTRRARRATRFPSWIRNLEK